VSPPSCFGRAWFLDTEFYQPDGERPRAICAVAKELFSRAVVKLWLWDQPSPPPFPIGPDVLVVCYAATAEWGVYHAQGWPLPVRILDLHVEYRWLMSGFKLPSYGQTAAMGMFELSAMDDTYKTDMRSLCRRGGPYSPQEAQAILSYCEQDVDGLMALFGKMEPDLQWPQALARGRYTAALSHVEAAGVPLDQQLYVPLRDHRGTIRRNLVEEVGHQFGVYDDDGSFDMQAFGQYLNSEDIPWPLTPTGRLSTAEDTFEEQVEIYPQLRPLCELRSALGQLKEDEGLQVGRDGRNRSPLRPFSTSTGRNAPSTTRFVLGKGKAFRHLIMPGLGMAVAVIDWGQVEFATAAVLSGDPNMQRVYASGNVYWGFAEQTGLVPPGAVREDHESVYEVSKHCVLGMGYGMGAAALARRIGRPLSFARELLQLYWRTFGVYQKWAGMILDQAMLTGRLVACHGWQVNVGQNPNPRSLRNFPVQANASEMFRLALSLAVERGVRVVAPIHDALMIETPLADIDEAVFKARQAMKEASDHVLV
jgi:hypothetical protein